MKTLTRQQLTRSLQEGKVDPLYLLIGSEAYLCGKAGCAIADEALRSTLLREFNESHFSLLTTNPRQAIAAALGGQVICADEPVHGRTSWVRHDGRRLFAGLPGAHPVRPAVAERLADEQQRGVSRPGYYADFTQQAARVRTELLALLAECKRTGRRIAAYGASAKGSTLLNYCGIGAETLDFVADRSTYKQGRLTPGTHLPIVAPGQLLARQPDDTLLLTWNFADEILAQQRDYRARGGRFIIPLPHARIV